ncbi:Gfo/Idh/MocA family oxidoreductase [Amaricoccus sp.]|uniref:Gfo/Idh/MocA family protein n=1 Tax=Amaricoccus sp. TaxID=1872485 RepID=UPI0025BFBF00|nr:Gfo/Idh/MocA family oxidoreductase [Amaricoccus sp.]
MTLRIAIVGLGKIARDQHLPAIAATEGAELAGVASRNAALPGLPHWPDVGALLADAGAGVDAVSVCTPPVGRFDQVRAALLAGKHVMMEKPPGATVSEVQALAALAAAQGVTLFATWHSRAAAAVEPARALLAARGLRGMRVTWKEDVRRWHPGQQWIWEPGGLGVFDPGINALSIVTRILPEPMRLVSADLDFPANRAAPIAARLAFRTAGGAPVTADLDWRQAGPQIWDIAADTAEGELTLSAGGARLAGAGVAPIDAEDREYRTLYAEFLALVAAGRSDVDLAPLVQVADAFLLGRRREVEPFHD